MSHPSFTLVVEQFLEDLMTEMESNPALEDVDMDLVDGVLTLEFEDGSQIIINRQESARQIWMVSPLGPAHFSFDDATREWLDDRSGESLLKTLNRAFSEKLGKVISIKT